jgi:hypothetical protein
MTLATLAYGLLALGHVLMALGYGITFVRALTP